MEEIPVTRAHLESLTTNDLIRMADNWGIDIPPDLDRIFIIEELLEIASEDSLDEEETAALSDETAVPGESKIINSNANESVPLPRQYNITFIEVMIRDPLWAFVFWEIKAADKEQFEKAQDFDGYYLKVSPWTAPVDKPMGISEDPLRRENETDGIFIVPVKSDDTSWYLGLAPAVEEGKFRGSSAGSDSSKGDGQASPPEQMQYKVELCVGRRGEETALAVSKPFRLPFLRELPTGAGKQKPNGVRVNPLVHLSGFEDFHVLRSSERLFRVKGGGKSGAVHE